MNLVWISTQHKVKGEYLNFGKIKRTSQVMTVYRLILVILIKVLFCCIIFIFFQRKCLLFKPLFTIQWVWISFFGSNWIAYEPFRKDKSHRKLECALCNHFNRLTTFQEPAIVLLWRREAIHLKEKTKLILLVECEFQWSWKRRTHEIVSSFWSSQCMTSSSVFHSLIRWTKFVFHKSSRP